MDRDYELATRLCRASDDLLVGVEEVAAFTGLAKSSIQQRKVAGPEPVSGQKKRLMWRLGDWRKWACGETSSKNLLARRPGRPTKAEQLGHTS
jgi:hypothetical protein